MTVPEDANHDISSSINPNDLMVLSLAFCQRRNVAMISSCLSFDFWGGRVEPVLSLDRIASDILGIEFSDALILDLSGSSNVWDQVRFAIQARSEGLPSPDLIFGAMFLIPNSSVYVGPFVLRSTLEAGYRPVAFVNIGSSSEISDAVRAASVAMALLLDHQEVFSSALPAVDVLTISGSLSSLLTYDARSYVYQARQILSSFSEISSISEGLSRTSVPSTSITRVPNRPVDDCRTHCGLASLCLSDKNYLISSYSLVMSDVFSGFSTLDQANRILSTPSDIYDPLHLQRAKFASREHDLLTQSEMAKNERK